MKRGYKLVPTFCPGCGARTPDSIVSADTMEPFIDPYLCWDCEHPEEVEAERLKWEEANRKINELYERGEIKDAQGNVIQ